MQVNGYIKKGPLIFLIVCAVLLSAYVLVEYGFFAFTEPPAPLVEKEQVQRGSILDRNGKALAVPAAFYDFGASPQSIKNKELFASVVSPVIGESESSILDLITKSGNSSFVYITRRRMLEAALGSPEPLEMVRPATLPLIRSPASWMLP